MKTILSLIRFDIASALRDNILLYIILAPVILSLGALALIPSVQNTTLRFAVDDSAAELSDALALYGKVEMIDNLESLEKRVEKYDDVPGIYKSDGKYILLFQGNENSKIIEAARMILTKAAGNIPSAEYEYREIGEKKTSLKAYLLIFIVLLASVFGGTVSGFNIVDERDTLSIRALSVSPAGFVNYLLAKGIVAAVIGIFMSVVTILIMNVAPVSTLQAIFALIALIPLSMFIALLIGTLAANQIAAIGVIKFIFPVLLTVPIVSIFVSPKWQPLFYALPNYWAFVMLKRLFLPDEFAPVNFYPALVFALLSGAAFMAALIPLSRKKLGIR